MSPTRRCLAHAKALGWTVQVVEHWNAFAQRRVDLFGCIDLVVLTNDPGVGPLGVQACAGASHATRRIKALAEPRIRRWLEQPARFEIWSWAKRGARGKAKRWTLRVEKITEVDFMLE